MPNNALREVLIVLHDWFAARQGGAEQVAGAVLRDRLDLLPAPFSAASRPGLTLAESAVINALDAHLQEAPSQPATAVQFLVEPAGLEDAFDRR
jgi:hypothetical protein